MPLSSKYHNCGKEDCKHCTDEAGKALPVKPHGPYYSWTVYIGTRRPPQELLDAMEEVERQVKEWRKGEGSS